MIGKFLSFFKWRYVGTVQGRTTVVDADGKPTPGGEHRCYWNLYERGDGKRRYETIGVPRGSPLSNYRLSEVKAWAKGGPMPTLCQQEEEPKTRQTKPKEEPKKAKLVVFPGGKDEAP